MAKRYRYPGSKPFEGYERHLFFGREGEIERIKKKLRVEPLVVLYGKSGLGKSSLINAGLVPTLKESLKDPKETFKKEKEYEYEVFSLRLGSYVPGEEGELASPLNRVLASIRRDRHTSSFLRKIARDHHSLWYSLKSIQIADKIDREFILVFDQFEELFSFPEKQIKQFEQELATLLNPGLPHGFRKAMQEKLDLQPDLISKEEMDALYRPLFVRCLIAVRSDKMSWLNRLRDSIPNILNSVYELRPMTREQAEDAILIPATLSNQEDIFNSPTFAYTDEALDKILDFLTHDNEKPIETFQLQILCQHVEENIVIKQYDTNVEPEDIGNPETIYQNYYDTQIEKLDTAEEKTKARRLIEEGLIFEEEERRVTLYGGKIKREYGVDDALIAKLVNSHLVRSEPDPNGTGFIYELSHDTLVAPILRSKAARAQKEETEKAIEHEKKISEVKENIFRKKLRQVRVIFISVSVIAAAFTLYFLILKNTELSIANKSLVHTQTKLEKAITRSDSLARANELVAESDKGFLMRDRDNWVDRYYKLIDSLEHMPRISSEYDSAATKQRITALKAENERLKANEIQYAQRVKKRMKTLNRKLVDDLFATEYKTNKEWIRLRDGIVKEYEDFEKTLD